MNPVNQFESIHRHEDAPLILVSGIGRSGTTALTRAIAAHPEVDSTNKESNVILDLLFAGQRGCTMPSRLKQMIVDQARYDAIFRRTVLELLWPNGEIVESGYRAISTYSGMRPTEATYLAQVFPRHLIAYVIRNGIEVVASRMVHRSFKSQPFDENCRVWATSLDMAKWGQDRESFLEVRHEHFRVRPRIEDVLQTAFKSLSLESVEPIIDELCNEPKHTTAVPGETDSSLDSRSERWRFWTDEQRDIFVEQCQPAMEYFGYTIPW